MPLLQSNTLIGKSSILIKGMTSIITLPALDCTTGQNILRIRFFNFHVWLILRLNFISLNIEMLVKKSSGLIVNV